MNQGNRAGSPKINIAVLYVPQWSFDNPVELLEHTRRTQLGLDWLLETKVITRRISPRHIPMNCRFVIGDLSRLGSSSEALTFILTLLLERNGELVTPGFRLIRSDPNFQTILSVFQFFADLKKAYRSAAVRDGLTLCKQRGGFRSNRKTISDEQQQAIRKTYAETKSMSRTAKICNCSKTSVHRAVRGRND